MISRQSSEDAKILLHLFLIGLLLTALYPSVSLAQNSPEYRIGPEDVIAITVTRHPEFSGDFYVPSDGTINIPVIGKTQASGKTVSELTSFISTGLTKRLREPEVLIAIKTPRMQRVYILGCVEKPGQYDVKPGWRITEAVAAAGGLSPGVEPSDCSATILKASENGRFTAKLSDAFIGKPESNAPIESGDVLTIEAGETLPIYVVGKVKNPGLYRLRKDTPGVLEALTLAGGVLDDAAVSKISITEPSGKATTVDLAPAILEGKKDVDAQLHSGDLVLVPEENSRVAVLGYVKEPGFYTVKSGRKLLLTDAIGLAKGVDEKTAGTDAIVVVRINEGKQDRLIFNLKKFLKSGDVSGNPEILPGDVVYVPKTGKPDWETISKSIGAIGLLINPFVR